MEVLRFAVLGLALGGVYSLLGMALVLTHRGSGVLNFSQAALGMLGTFVYFDLRHDQFWPFFPSLAVGFALPVAVATLNYLLVMRRLENSSIATKIVATLGLMFLILGISNLVFAPTGDPMSMPSVLPTDSVELVAGVAVGWDRIAIAALAVAVAALLVLLQRKTRLGLATTAVVENRVVAASMGLSPNVTACVNWGLGALVGTIGVFLVAPISGLDTTNLVMLIIPGMAAALVGRFASFIPTLVGGLGIGVVQSEMSRYVDDRGWATAAPLVVIVFALVVRGKYIPSKADVAARMAGVGPGTIGRHGLLIGLSALAVVAVASPIWLGPITMTILFGLVALSVIVVTGYAGQISLVQLSLAGTSAFIMAALMSGTNVPAWLAILLAAFATIPVGMLVAIPALRTRGSSLAIASLALASVIESLILNNPRMVASVSEHPMRPLTLFGLGFDAFSHPRSYAILCALVLCAALAITGNLRRGASGLRLLAVRANERAAMSLGISVSSAKLFAFAYSAFVAGVAGALLEAQLMYADFSIFTVLGSIGVTLNSVLGGVGWPSGAVAGGGGLASGGVASQFLSSFVAPGNWLIVISGASAIVVVLQSPDGLVPWWIDQTRKLTNRIGWVSRRRHSRSVAGDTSWNDSARKTPVRPSGTLEVRDVAKRFGGQVALSHVSLTVRPGEIVGLIGPNGAGKSTLIDVISGFERQDAGDVILQGASIGRLAPANRSRRGISRSFQTLELFEDMTILDNIRVASGDTSALGYANDILRPRHLPLTEVAVDAVEKFGLVDCLLAMPSSIDSARRRLAAIARAVASNPSYLMLDEPAAGLDLASRSELGRVLRRLTDEWNLGVLLVEHDVDLVFALCDRVVALDGGRVICEGTPAVVRSDPRLIAAYLGSEPEGDQLQETGEQAIETTTDRGA